MAFLLLVVGCTLLADDKATTFTIYVKDVDPVTMKELEKSIRSLEGVAEALAAKDGSVRIVMKQAKDERTVTLTQLRAAIAKAGQILVVDEPRTEISGTVRVATHPKEMSERVEEVLKKLENVTRVTKLQGDDSTAQFDVELQKGKSMKLDTLLRAVNGCKVNWEDINVVWVCPPKEKKGGKSG